jgi:hypothetical protein
MQMARDSTSITQLLCSYNVKIPPPPQALCLTFKATIAIRNAMQYKSTKEYEERRESSQEKRKRRKRETVIVHKSAIAKG